MGSYSYSLDRMYSSIFGDQPDNFVELSEEQKRKKAEEEKERLYRESIPGYGALKAVEEGVLDTPFTPGGATIRGGVEGIGNALGLIGEGRDIATSAVAGVPEQPYIKTVRGALYGDEFDSPYEKEVKKERRRKTLQDAGYDDEEASRVSKIEAGEVEKTMVPKIIGATSDPAQLAFMAGGPVGAAAGAVLAPGMIAGGASEIGTGISGLESGDEEKGWADIASGAMDVGMGGLGLKHAVGSVGSVVSEAYPDPLKRPVEWERDPRSLYHTSREGLEGGLDPSRGVHVNVGRPVPGFEGSVTEFNPSRPIKGMPSPDLAEGWSLSRLKDKGMLTDAEIARVEDAIAETGSSKEVMEQIFREKGYDPALAYQNIFESGHPEAVRDAMFKDAATKAAERLSIERGRPVDPSEIHSSDVLPEEAKAAGFTNESLYVRDPALLGEGRPEPIYLKEAFGLEGLPSQQRGAIALGGEGLGKLNAFEDSQFRKYGADWRRAQSPEESIYHEKLLKGFELEREPPVESVGLEEPTPEEAPVEAPKTAPEEQLAKVMPPKMAERVMDLVEQGHDLDRAVRIVKAEGKEAAQGPEALTTDDLEALMSAKEPPIYKKPQAITSAAEAGIGTNEPMVAEPLIGTEEPMVAEPLKRGRPRKLKPSEEPMVAEPLPEGVEENISPREIALIDKISNAQTAEELSSLKDEARQLGMENRLTRELQKAQFREKRAGESADVRRMQEAYNLKRQMIKVQVKEKLKAEKAAGRLVKPLPENAILESDNFRQAWDKMSPAERALAPFEVLRALRASGDIPMLRQGKQISYDMLFNDPMKLAESLKSTVKQALSTEEFKATQDALTRDPNIKLGVDKFGLDLPGIGKGLKEEAFHGGITTKVPGISKYIIGPSDRAYTAFLNSARAWKFNHIVKKLGEAGFEISNPEHAQVFKDAAKAVNIMSSRGHFGPGTVAALNKLSVAMWAPRHRLAKAQTLTEYVKARTGVGEQMHPVVARDFTKSVERVSAVNLALLGLASATGAATVNWDPRHTDFAKFRIGGSVIDPWMGLQPIVRDAARAAAGKEISSTGRESNTSLAEQFGEYMASGAAPGPALAWNMLTGKDVRGYDKDRLTAALESITPMLVWNIGEQLYYNGITDAIVSAPSTFFGEGVDVRKGEGGFGRPSFSTDIFGGKRKRRPITTFGGG